jgi:hypothetical protein
VVDSGRRQCQCPLDSGVAEAARRAAGRSWCDGAGDGQLSGAGEQAVAGGWAATGGERLRSSAGAAGRWRRVEVSLRVRKGATSEWGRGKRHREYEIWTFVLPDTFVD